VDSVQALLIIAPLSGVDILQTVAYEPKRALTGAYWLGTSTVFSVHQLRQLTLTFSVATCNSSTFVINMSPASSVPSYSSRPKLPLYRTAMRTIAALYSVFIHRSNGAHRRENARDRLAAQGEREALRGAPAAGEDNETDKKDLGFRYVLWRRLEILGRIG